MKINKVKLLFNRLLTTANIYEEDVIEDGVIMSHKGELKPYQEVLELGSTVRNVKVGDVIMVDPSRYEKKQYDENSMKNGVIDHNVTIGYEFDIIEVDDKACLLLFDSDIKYIIDKFEE